MNGNIGIGMKIGTGTGVGTGIGIGIGTGTGRPPIMVILGVWVIPGGLRGGPGDPLGDFGGSLGPIWVPIQKNITNRWFVDPPWRPPGSHFETLSRQNDEGAVSEPFFGKPVTSSFVVYVWMRIWSTRRR